MGTIVVTEFITLDGVVEDPGGGEGSPYGGWAFGFDRGADGDRFKFDELMAADAQLLGRRAYEGFAQAWPKMNDNDFGRKFNSMPKHVVTSTLHALEWGRLAGPGSGAVRGRRARLRQRAARAGAPGRRARRPAQPDAAGETVILVYRLKDG
jgi:hypothetical protein